jgi:hypothetical protein
MRATLATHVIFLIATLVVAFTSSILLTLPWFHLTSEGRTHPFYFGVLPLFTLVDAFPFSWPFAINGFILRRLDSPGAAFCWSLGIAAVGVVLSWFLAHVRFASEGALFVDYLSVGMRFTAPMFYALAGFLLAHLLRSQQKT